MRGTRGWKNICGLLVSAMEKNLRERKIAEANGHT